MGRLLKCHGRGNGNDRAVKVACVLLAVIVWQSACSSPKQKVVQGSPQPTELNSRPNVLVLCEVVDASEPGGQVVPGAKVFAPDGSTDNVHLRVLRALSVVSVERYEDPMGYPGLWVDFSPVDSKWLEEYTAKNVGKLFVMLHSGRAVFEGLAAGPVRGRFPLTNRFSPEEVEELERALASP